MTTISFRNLFEKTDTYLENIYPYIEEGTTRDAVVSIIGSTIITLAASKGDPRSLFILYTSQFVEVFLITMIKIERSTTFLKKLSPDQMRMPNYKELEKLSDLEQKKAVRNKIREMLPPLKSSDKCVAFVLSYLMGMGLALYMGFKVHYKTSAFLALGIYAINYCIVKKLIIPIKGKSIPLLPFAHYLATIPLPIMGISVTK